MIAIISVHANVQAKFSDKLVAQYRLQVMPIVLLHISDLMCNKTMRYPPLYQPYRNIDYQMLYKYIM